MCVNTRSVRISTAAATALRAMESELRSPVPAAYEVPPRPDRAAAPHAPGPHEVVGRVARRMDAGHGVRVLAGFVALVVTSPRSASLVSASMATVIAAVAFDVDGTLLDHERAAGDAVRGWVAARGWRVPEDAGAQWLRLEREHFAAFAAGAITFEEQRRRRLRAFLPLVTSARVVEEDLDALFAEYATVYESHWVAFDDAVEVLDDLAAAGYVLGVLTNGQRAQQVAKLARIGLLDRFGVVVASSELPAGKPDPHAFTVLCQRLGAAPGSVMFVGDDPVTDVAGALDAGLQAVFIDRDQAGHAADRAVSIRSLTKLPAALTALNLDKGRDSPR